MMKHLINILVILILTGFAVGTTVLLYYDRSVPWGILYVPIGIFMLLWGIKLNNDY